MTWLTWREYQRQRRVRHRDRRRRGSLAVGWAGDRLGAEETGRHLATPAGEGVFPAPLSEQIRFLLQSGPVIGPATLLRFYVAHVILLPVLAGGLFYLHLKLVRRHGPVEPW